MMKREMKQKMETPDWVSWTVIVLLALAAIVANTTIMLSAFGVVVFMLLLSGRGYLVCRYGGTDE